MTFSCTEDSAKLKLYDVGADLSLDNAIRILALKEATKFELRETKSASIDSVRQKYVHKRKGDQTYHNASHKHDKLCGYCNTIYISTSAAKLTVRQPKANAISVRKLGISRLCVVANVMSAWSQIM